MSKPIPPTPSGVKTAWADAEHMRLAHGTVDELLATLNVTRRKGIDPDDPWATPPEGGEAA